MSLFSSPPPELFATAAAAAAASTTTPAAQAAAGVVDPADHPPLRGRGLRWVLLDELKRHTELSVARMARILAAHGFHLGPGRASKLISDALRWEVRRGRITRPARGVYRWSGATYATSRRITILAQRSREWIAAARSRRTPALFPQTWRDRKHPYIDIPVHSPPWTAYGWLWNT